MDNNCPKCVELGKTCGECSLAEELTKMIEDAENDRSLMEFQAELDKLGKKI